LTAALQLLLLLLRLHHHHHCRQRQLMQHLRPASPLRQRLLRLWGSCCST
jgi:hypothetical protein